MGHTVLIYGTHCISIWDANTSVWVYGSYMGHTVLIYGDANTSVWSLVLVYGTHCINIWDTLY